MNRLWLRTDSAGEQAEARPAEMDFAVIVQDLHQGVGDLLPGNELIERALEAREKIAVARVQMGKEFVPVASEFTPRPGGFVHIEREDELVAVASADRDQVGWGALDRMDVLCRQRGARVSAHFV